MNDPAVTQAPEAGETVHSSSLARLGQQPVVLLVLAAIILRLIVFTSRGDYVAYDEGWYLLLGRSLFQGDGYTLTGLRHTTLSPLFPILAGAVGTILGDMVWGGRIVAALTAGLLVWPCWYLFRRIAGARVATIASLFIVVMPSLTPFAAPYWIDWDLWVGAEPLLHLFLFAGLALALRALDRKSMPTSAMAGAAFGLAYLARPEALIVFGIVGVAMGTGALARRSAGHTVRALVMALAFFATAAPYWFYLHDTLGRWALSGRAVDLPARRSIGQSGAPDASRAGQGRGAASGIERMLWQGDNRPYVRLLYGLDATRTRLGSTYWGIPEPLDSAGLAAVSSRVNDRTADSVTADAAAPAPTTEARSAGRSAPGRWELYARALGTVVPWFVWPLIIIGIPGRRPAWKQELLVVGPIIITSFAVARLVGADPRTQLLVVPLAALYAAWGISRVGDAVDRRVATIDLRPGFVTRAASVVMACALLSIVGRWVYLGISMGSPHHTVGAANRAIGDALRELTPPDAPVISWHPAIALYADRDWRVLPYAPLEDIVRYADASDSDHIVLSAYYPGSQFIRDLPRDHLVLRVPPAASAATGAVRIELEDEGESYILGRVHGGG